MIKKEYIAIAILVLMLASISALSLISISEQSGNAHAVNYASLVRGGTQHLVKKELYNHPDDELRTRLDGIVNDLIDGSTDSENDLVALPDADFQARMQQVKQSWSEIENQIFAVRAAPNDQKARERLFSMSEDFFTLADQMVSAAEAYSKGQVEVSRNIILGANLIFALLLAISIAFIVRQQALQRKAEQFKTMALLDTLSGIPNRMRCEQECQKIEADKPAENVAVFMFDMNNLKIVNDKFGHKSDDNLISVLARILGDWATANNGFVGRFGGDEFLAIFVDIDLDCAERYLNELYANVDSYNSKQKSQFDQISFAAGYTVNNLAIVDMEVMIIDADRAMYERKRQMKTMD